MATKRPFLSDIDLQETLTKLQKTNEDEIILIGQLSAQCDVLKQEIESFNNSTDPV